MKNIRVFLSESFLFLEVKFSIYLNRRVFVMRQTTYRLKLVLLARSLILNSDAAPNYKYVFYLQSGPPCHLLYITVKHI